MRELFEKAKEMEKEQIIDAINFGDERGKITTYSTSEQYYNQTFKSE
jgi:Ni,Fe-hydrogenase maturation factor